MNTYQNDFPEIASYFENADYIDLKMIDGSVSLRQFIAGMLNYQPAWMTFLYGVRGIFVRFLGMKQDGMPRAVKLDPSLIPMIPGKNLSFFKVERAEENHYWVGSAEDTHLKGVLAVVMRPLPNGVNHFYIFTVVHYHNWAGPVYFNVIRPFHHIVVKSMTHAAVAPV